MVELGLYEALPTLDAAHPRAVPFQPGYELWSNGTRKSRYLLLPPGTVIDTSDSSQWQFPIGTLFFKTFQAPRVRSSGRVGEGPIETRVLQRLDHGWEYALYVWNEDGTDAERVDLLRPVPIAVELEGERFEHVVPNKTDCRKCHESQEQTIIGFDALRLSSAVAASMRSELDALAEAGVFTVAPAPETIAHEDTSTRDVLGYLHGNCAHCHNGGDGPSSAFDMRYPVALDNLIGRETQGEVSAGIRVVPGDRHSSALFLALTRSSEVTDILPMPPVGVERADSAAIELIGSWIDSLSEATE